METWSSLKKLTEKDKIFEDQQQKTLQRQVCTGRIFKI